jgi:hypothetical protein
MMALTPDQEKLKEAALAVQSKKEPGGQFYQQDFANLANPAAILAILAQLSAMDEWRRSNDPLYEGL